jgi:hypothetical protein
MTNKVVGDFMRLNKTLARKAFESGESVYVMSIDRNPITSLTCPYKYYIGCKSLWGWHNGKTEVNTFDELLEDFSEWLYADGYGHVPQRYDAKHYRFSYWVKKSNN